MPSALTIKFLRESIAPFGWPVVPEVKRTSARCSSPSSDTDERLRKSFIGKPSKSLISVFLRYFDSIFLSAPFWAMSTRTLFKFSLY